MKDTWPVKKLSDIANIQTGKHNASHAQDDGEYRFYTCAMEHQYCDTKKFEGECIILPGNGANVGEVFYFNGEFDAYQRTYVIDEITEFPRYVYYHLKGFWKEYNLNKQYGSATNYIKMGNFTEYEIPLPPLDEQKRIVAILDEAFEAIEQTKENIKRNIKNAEELFQSNLNNLIANQDTKWEEKLLKDITTKIGSGATPRGGEKSYKKSGISLIRSLNVYDDGFKEEDLAFIDNEQASKLDRVKIEKDDVLLNITGASVARCCIVPDKYLPARVNQHVSIIRLKKDTMRPKYLHYCLISEKNKSKLLGISDQGATRQAITKSQIKNFKVRYPRTYEEQDKIIRSLNSFREFTTEFKSIHKKKLLNLEKLKSSILQQAFLGNLTKKELVV